MAVIIVMAAPTVVLAHGGDMWAYARWYCSLGETEACKALRRELEQFQAEAEADAATEVDK